MRPWLREAGVPDEEWTIEGDPAARRFVLRLRGAVGYASRRVQRCLILLRPTQRVAPSDDFMDWRWAAHLARSTWAQTGAQSRSSGISQPRMPRGCRRASSPR
eukprot:3399295-Pyramimonas_sp.AAC.1